MPYDKKPAPKKKPMPRNTKGLVIAMKKAAKKKGK